MPIDNALVSPVNHYLGGMAGAASAQHEEAAVKGNLEELAEMIETAKSSFIANCADMLANPSKYAKIDGYQLRPEDKDFLNTLLSKAEQGNWLNSRDVDELNEHIASYCPANPIREGFLRSKE